MITTGLCWQAKADFFSGVHQPNDRYMVALYTGLADIGPQTTHYTTDGEVRGKGYKPGGVPLKGVRAWVDREAGCWTAESPTIPNATIRARGFLIYNASKSNRAIGVVDWGGEYASTEGPFTIRIAADQFVIE